MATKRVKKVIPQNVSREQMEDAFAKFQLADAKQQRITADMDAKITAIREKFQDSLIAHEAEKEAALTIMQAWATENQETIFGKKKSITTAHGTLGFRTSTPKLKTLKGFTWASVTNLVKEFLPAYIRTKDEPMKDKLLADRENEEVMKHLEKCGIEVVQDETFYVEPKKEEVTA